MRGSGQPSTCPGHATLGVDDDAFLHLGDGVGRADHWKKRFPELEKELLDTYYKFKGWNKEGIPTKASLDAMGLDFVSADLIQRGILTANDKASSDEAAKQEE